MIYYLIFIYMVAMGLLKFLDCLTTYLGLSMWKYVLIDGKWQIASLCEGNIGFLSQLNTFGVWAYPIGFIITIGASGLMCLLLYLFYSHPFFASNLSVKWVSFSFINMIIIGIIIFMIKIVTSNVFYIVDFWNP